MEEEAPTEKRMMNSMNHTKWILYNEIAEAYFESNIEDGVFYEHIFAKSFILDVSLGSLLLLLFHLFLVDKFIS